MLNEPKKEVVIVNWENQTGQCISKIVNIINQFK